VSELATTVRETPIPNRRAAVAEKSCGRVLRLPPPGSGRTRRRFAISPPPMRCLLVRHGDGGASGGEPDSCRAASDRDIAAIDALLGSSSTVLHQPVCAGSRTLARPGWLRRIDRPPVRLKVLNYLGELCRDLERAVEFDQSQLSRNL